MRATLAGLAGLAALAVAGERWIATTELPPLAPPVSTTVLDREGRLLRAYTVEDGLWRLPQRVRDTDSGYLAQLIAYEDKRFSHHPGVDPIAMLRAAVQAALAGRIVSGGSTLTMQVARLLEDLPTGKLRAKLRQIRVALALERRLEKDEILELYLALAPFGGNIEGVRTASLSWFGKEPTRLTPAEAALLVVLPQSPEARRPDRHPETAREARNRALDRAAAAGVLTRQTAEAARREPLPTARLPLPQLAPHLADRLRRGDPYRTMHRTVLDSRTQRRLERLLAERATQLHPALSVALIAVDHASGDIVARVGSPDLFDGRRHGFVDMSRAIRSPGSTLKPLIFGLAFDRGIAHPETLVEDRPTPFGRYAPQNFDGRYYGTVTAREALQRSLNIPSVALLEAVGPARLVARLRMAGAKVIMPGDARPGLPIALGGLGLRLEDLAAIYAALARGGEAVALRETPDVTARTGPRLISPAAGWHVADVLSGVPPPPGAPKEAIAFKTGTSYGHRDAWAVGFDGRHTVAIWVGRPDGASAPGILGIGTAAPLLFDAFARIAPQRTPLPPAPPEALRVGTAELPAPLQRFRRDHGERAERERLAIAFPPDGATLEMQSGLPGTLVPVKLRNGRPPFRWLVNGAPHAPDDARSREILIPAEGPGALTLSVIDASGAAGRTEIWLQ